MQEVGSLQRWLIKSVLQDQFKDCLRGINFGMKAGLNMEDVIEVISKGAAQSWQMENRYKTMIEDKFDFGFAVDWMRKELKIAMEEAKNNGSLLPVTELVDKYYGEVQGMGGNRWDTSSLIKRFRKQTRMQPAYYENLEEIQNKYWTMLNDAVTNSIIQH